MLWTRASKRPACLTKHLLPIPYSRYFSLPPSFILLTFFCPHLALFTRLSAPSPLRMNMKHLPEFLLVSECFLSHCSHMASVLYIRNWEDCYHPLAEATMVMGAVWVLQTKKKSKRNTASPEERSSEILPPKKKNFRKWKCQQNEYFCKSLF